MDKLFEKRSPQKEHSKGEHKGGEHKGGGHNSFAGLLRYALVMLVFLGACELPEEEAPIIESISPLRAETGATLTIRGKNFGRVKEQVTVKFGTVPATDLLSVADTEIQVVVPDIEGNQTGKVTVIVEGRSSAASSSDVTIEGRMVLEPPTRFLRNTTHLFREDSRSVSSNLDLPSPDLGNRVLYGVSCYEMQYESRYKGQTLTSSGLVCLPRERGHTLPILSLHHGTITQHGQAPSVLGRSRSLPVSEDEIHQASLLHRLYVNMGYLAGLGFAVFIPDYLGFGASEDEFHPFFAAEPLAQDVIRGIQATWELTRQQGHYYNGEVYLAGYSEGGYVTMAVHRSLELNPIANLKVKSSGAGAGVYDINLMRRLLPTHDPFGTNVYPQPFFLPYLFLAYQDAYGISTTAEALFIHVRPPKMGGFDPMVGRLEDESRDYYDEYVKKANFENAHSDTLNRNLATAVFQGGGYITFLRELLHPVFLNEATYLTEDEFADFRARVNENSLEAWAPEAPIRMYHTNNDELVPYATSSSFFGQLQGALRMAGRPVNSVQLLDLPLLNVPPDSPRHGLAGIEFFVRYMLAITEPQAN